MNASDLLRPSLFKVTPRFTLGMRLKLPLPVVLTTKTHHNQYEVPMLALIHDEDPHSRSALRPLLAGDGGIGYKTTLTVADIHEAEYLVRQNGDRIKLILAARGPRDGLDLPIARLVMDHPELNSVPFILMSNDWLPSSLSRIRSHYSRIDDCLPKPFGRQQLQQSLSRAHRSRARHRDSLLVVGREWAPRITEALYTCRSLVHWREVIAVSSADELENQLETLGFRAGGIVVDPGACDARVIALLARFKKTTHGLGTPIAALSRDPQVIRDLRCHCDIFLDRSHVSEPLDWEELVTLLSRRVLFFWDARQLLTRGRQALKTGNPAWVASLARQGLMIDPDRWEFRELAGAAAGGEGKGFEAIEHFRAALAMNPCSPFPYLNLLRLPAGSERTRIMAVAEAYCFAHPQIRAEIARLRELDPGA
jgi:CheY-like chemotaxis protein